jgi:signal peptidase I
MNVLEWPKRFWNFLKEDSWQSWLVSLILAFVAIKFVFFPLLSFAMATPLPLVVIESCSMYHGQSFDEWWQENGDWYEVNGISKAEFREFSFRNGMNKGDIVLVTGRGGYSVGEVIIFESTFRHPLIHRIVDENPLGTKGDNNPGQLAAEQSILEEDVLGKALVRVPWAGWIKLIFFEGTRPADQRGFC